jgi:transcription initiation factor TFIID subunit TAF12
LESNELKKIARTEALFREVNERIAETAERFDATETNFVCECAEPTCTHRVEATLEEYERVREEGDTFLLVPGHEDERVEAVVKAIDDHAVVEKRHPLVRRLVLALDPRSPS